MKLTDHYQQLTKNIFNIRFFWWAVLALALVIFHLSHNLDSDEGIVLNGAWNLINGRELYYDTFEYMAPGSFYLVFWVWKIFGASYAAAGIFSLLAMFGGAVGVARISRMFTDQPVAYLAPVLYFFASVFWPLINHNTYGTVLAIWAVYLFLSALLHGGPRQFFTAGLLTGLTALFLQQKGLSLLASESLFIVMLALKNKNGRMLKNALVFGAGAILPLAALFLKWSPSLLYQNLILYPLDNYTRVRTISPIFILLFFTALSGAIWILRKERRTTVWAAITIQIFLLFSALNNPDVIHTSQAAFILFALLPLTLIGHTGGWRKFAVAAPCALVVLMIFPGVIIHTYLSPPFMLIDNSFILRFIRNNCGGSDYIYAGPFLPGIYFETRKLNPTPFHILLSTFQTEEQFLTARLDLEKYRPQCAVLNYELTEKWEHDQDNPVDRFIQENYRPLYQEGDEVVYVINRMTDR